LILYVPRHGETDYNAQGRYAGSTDVPLNDCGLNQAKELAQKLVSVHFDVIVASPLTRAKQTAEIVRGMSGIPIVFDARLAERNMGVYEGLTREEARERYPKTWAKLGAKSPDDAPEGGETIGQVDARVTAALERIETEYGDKSVLVVCHGFVSRIINRYFTGLSYDEMHAFTLENCGIVQYELSIGGYPLCSK